MRTYGRHGMRSTCLGLSLMLTPGVATADLFALVDTGELFASEDGAASWEIRATLPVSDAVSLAAGETATDLHLATRAGVVYLSADAGASWAAAGVVAASDVVAMTLRTDGAVLCLTESGIVWESNDEGRTFAALSSIPASNWVSLSRSGSNTLYALTRTGEVARSVDGGSLWSYVGGVPSSDGVEIIADDDLWIVAESGTTYRSADDGVSWIAVGTLSQVHTSSLVRASSGAIYATTREGEVGRLDDLHGRRLCQRRTRPRQCEGQGERSAHGDCRCPRYSRAWRESGLADAA